MKAERTAHRTTFIPSSAKPGETLYVDVPRLGENMVFVPKSMFLRFNVKIDNGTCCEQSSCTKCVKKFSEPHENFLWRKNCL